MKQGEKIILLAIVLAVVGTAAFKLITRDTTPDKGIPFHSTASAELASEATAIYNRNSCKDCHSLWTERDMLQAVPAPALDGIGSLHDEEWFYKYFSASNPQEIIPSRLKKQYRMPSFANLSEKERRTLARYMASLKVDDWYLEETRKAEYEKLTGKDYHQ
jgi:cbb3-type cytochrome oxidase cytochrome c subunit